MTSWYKIQVWILTCLCFCLYFWMVFTDGKIPEIEQKFDALNKKVEAIDYHIQNDHSKDTISVIIQYPQQLKKK